MRKLSLLLAACAMIALPASAGAQTQVPEHDSALDQYVESLPGSGGNERTDKGARGGGQRGTLPAGVRSALEARGPLGAAVAELAEASGISTPASGREGGGADGGGSGEVGGAVGGDQRAGAISAAAEDGSGPSGVLRALFGDVGGGMGIALPIIIAGAALAAVAVAVARRRRGGGSAPPA